MTASAMLRVHVVTRLLAEAVQRIDGRRTRNVYWANCYIALPVFLERYQCHFYLLLEEKMEQDFLSRKRHFAAKSGQIDLQEMFYRDEHKNDRASRRRQSQFVFRYAPFRAIKVRSALVSGHWIAGISSTYRDLITEDDDMLYTTFHCGGNNDTVTTVTFDEEITRENEPIVIDF